MAMQSHHGQRQLASYPGGAFFRPIEVNTIKMRDREPESIRSAERVHVQGNPTDVGNDAKQTNDRG